MGEKEDANKLMKRVVEQLGGWYQRIADTPHGAYANRKPFDGTYTFRGVAFEFKKKNSGKTFNLDTEWREKEPHQEIGLRQFEDSGAGVGILVVFWKRNNRIHVRFMPVKELINRKKIGFDEMYNEDNLIWMMKGLRDA